MEPTGTAVAALAPDGRSTDGGSAKSSQSAPASVDDRQSVAAAAAWFSEAFDSSVLLYRLRHQGLDGELGAAVRGPEREHQGRASTATAGGYRQPDCEETEGSRLCDYDAGKKFNYLCSWFVAHLKTLHAPQTMSTTLCIRGVCPQPQLRDQIT